MSSLRAEKKSRMVKGGLKSTECVVLDAGVSISYLQVQWGISLFHAEFLGIVSKMKGISVSVFPSALGVLES